MEKNKIVMAVDFGNSYIRVAVKLNGQIYSLENEDSLKQFPQILAVDEEFTYFGSEAENNLIGYCNSYYKNFKYNCMLSNTDDFINSLITKILLHYKDKSVEFVTKNFQQTSDIDTVILTIPVFDPEKKWRHILKNCSINAGFKNVHRVYEEKLAIDYYMRNNLLKENYSETVFFIFNLACLSFNLSKWNYQNNKLNQLILMETKGGFSINTLLQNLFNKKIREIIKKDIFKQFINPEQIIDIEKLFNNDAFESNKKFMAECHRKYQQVLDIFSGKSKSMQLQFRHIINKQEIEIEILRNDIDELLLFFKNNIKLIIDEFKKCNCEKNYTFIIVGNGIKIPGVVELFVSEFKEDFLFKNIYNNEEILKVALLRE
jgi:hypothetical protein